MSEYLWGVCMQKLSESECARRDEACIAEGGYGYSQIKDGPQWKGWFSGPQRGDPFDGNLQKRVAARLGLVQNNGRFRPIPVTRDDAGGPLWTVGEIIGNQYVELGEIPSHSYDAIQKRCNKLNTEG